MSEQLSLQITRPHTWCTCLCTSLHFALGYKLLNTTESVDMYETVDMYKCVCVCVHFSA
jgi:hypothetical protein